MSEQKDKFLDVPPSKIVQIMGDNSLYALCEDGSVLEFTHNGKWHMLSPAHVANRQQASGSADETQRKARLWDVMWELKAVGRIYAQVNDCQSLGIAYTSEGAADLLERLAGEVKP